MAPSQSCIWRITEPRPNRFTLPCRDELPPRPRFLTRIFLPRPYSRDLCRKLTSINHRSMVRMRGGSMPWHPGREKKSKEHRGPRRLSLASGPQRMRRSQNGRPRGLSWRASSLGRPRLAHSSSASVRLAHCCTRQQQRFSIAAVAAQAGHRVEHTPLTSHPEMRRCFEKPCSLFSRRCS